jgi:hypothetical protein
MERRRNELDPEVVKSALRSGAIGIRSGRNAIEIEFALMRFEEVAPRRHGFIGLIAVIFGHCALPHGASRRIVKLLQQRHHAIHGAFHA